MMLQSIRNQLGDYAKDIRLNFDQVLTEEGAPDLKLPQILGIALASAYATKNNDLVDALIKDYPDQLTVEMVQAAKSAATIMAMNNVYYRFTHLASDQEIRLLPAKLRMNVLANPGIDKMDFELMNLAVSAINGCGACMDAHVNQLIKAGVSRLGVQSCIRIASVVNAVTQAMSIGS